jgi:hypothetical protein
MRSVAPGSEQREQARRGAGQNNFFRGIRGYWTIRAYLDARGVPENTAAAAVRIDRTYYPGTPPALISKLLLLIFRQPYTHARYDRKVSAYELLSAVAVDGLVARLARERHRRENLLAHPLRTSNLLRRRGHLAGRYNSCRKGHLDARRGRGDPGIRDVREHHYPRRLHKFGVEVADFQTGGSEGGSQPAGATES